MMMHNGRAGLALLVTILALLGFSIFDNLRSSYDAVCDAHGIGKILIPHIGGRNLYPYFNVSFIPVLRRQAFRCLLSIRGVCHHIEDFMDSLENDDQLLDICEEVEDQDLQLFLISFVEFNIDTDTLLISRQNLLQACRKHDLMPLAQLFNEFLRKLTDICIEHQLSEYTPDNLPPIELFV